MDRITAIDARQWHMESGGKITAQYDVPEDAWYFAANGQPFAVLLEIALQPCGWFAAYLGSALTSDIHLSFRNLGGAAVNYQPLTRDIGTLTTYITITQVANSAIGTGGMIGMVYATRHPEKIRRLIIMNTAAFHLLATKKLPWQLWLVRHCSHHDCILENLESSRLAYASLLFVGWFCRIFELFALETECLRFREAKYVKQQIISASTERQQYRYLNSFPVYPG